jgi:hypothetical protein
MTILADYRYFRHKGIAAAFLVLCHRFWPDSCQDRIGPVLMRAIIVLLAFLTISGCGMAKAARETGQAFDRYGCLARDFKREPPCGPNAAATLPSER